MRLFLVDIEGSSGLEAKKSVHENDVLTPQNLFMMSPGPLPYPPPAPLFRFVTLVVPRTPSSLAPIVYSIYATTSP